MTPDTTSAVWVPVCCGRVMRCNMFRLPVQAAGWRGVRSARVHDLQQEHYT
jgi:hypothetical protein